MSNEYDFELLVHKKLTNQLTDEESTFLNQQLHDEASRQLAEELTRIWNESANISEQVSFNKDKAKQAFFNKIKTENTAEIIQLKKDYTPRNNYKWMYFAAAIASMLLIGFFAFYNVSDQNDDVIFASSGRPQKIELPDGSKVHLAANSSISYDNKTFNGSRAVEMVGTALFEVAKKGTSFVVKTKHYNVDVLGTTFTVNTSKDNQEVKVLEGRVRVKTPSAKELIITDRQGAKINNEQIEKIENIDFSTDKWFEPEMIYQNTPLSKVVSDIETKFSVKFTFKPNQDIRNCTFSSGGSLKEIPLNQMITIMESALDAKIEKKETNNYAFVVLNCK